MRIFIVVCLSFVALLQDIFAQDTSVFSGYVSTGPQHGYIGRRIARNLYDDWMLWSEVQINHKPTGLFLNLWNSTQFDRHSPLGNGGNELDIALGWHGPIKDWFELEVSTVLFDIDPVQKLWTDDVALQSVALSKTLLET